ncbi:MAG: OmpA family protein, partial [Rikenellaceae bacterium]
MVSLTFAQSSKEDSDVVVGTDAIWENWFVSGGVGTTMFAGESDRFGTIGSRLAFDFDISLGKWFTPYMGARLQYSGARLRGNTDAPDNIFATGNASSNGLYEQKWNYSYFHFDAMLNLSNFIGGYNEDRFYSFIPYAGAGWARTSKNKNDALTVNLGLYNSFKVNSRLDLFFDIRGVIIGEDAIDGEVGGDYGIDGMLTASVGVNIRLGKHGWNRPVSQSVIDGYKSTISTNESEIENYKSQLEKTKKENAKLKKQLANEKCAESEGKSSSKAYIPETVVSFELNSSKLSNLAKVNLSKIAKVIKKYPSSEKYLVVGYADKGTGSEDGNYKLSKARARAVYDYLTEECDVEPSKLVVESKGGVDNMFYDDATLSRVVIIE